jgi:DNA end-binding protein Ku
VRAGDGLLVLNTLLFPEDIRDPAQELKSLPEIATARGKELDMAVNLIESMTDEWRPEDYHDAYTEQVEKLIDSKREGREIVAAEEPSEPTKVVDLFEALSRSVESRKKGRAPSPSPALDDLSKAELDKLAKELDVKGRSKMNRDELAKAVAEAQSSAAAS